MGSLKKIISFLLLIVFNHQLKGQQIEPIQFYKAPKYTRRINNPALLVAAITKGKTSEKEKFDAIFNWVATNIDYDYRTYFSSSGTKPRTVKKLLKNKTGVCLHYAFLMDTLCALADITNVTVLGYAKDELFDVNDTIYMDNHAWNAVKLDGLWYLYDVTYATGEVYYRFTKFTSLINYLIKNWALGYKEIVIKPKRRFFFFYDCNQAGERDSTLNNIKKTVPYIKHKLLFLILTRFKPKMVRDFKKNMDAGYYLTQPELFAIEHFPDNPVWSLTATKTMRQFEEDSAFYHLNKEMFNNQNRQGRTCPDCDAELYQTPLNWSLNMRTKSLNFNPRNRFITSTCEYCVALVKFNEAKKAKDSLTKVTLLDSSRMFLNLSRASMRRSGINMGLNFTSQKEKNLRKVQALMDENNKHSAFIRNRMVLTTKETRNIKDLRDEMDIYTKKIFRRTFSLRFLNKGQKYWKTKTPTEKIEKALKTEHEALNVKIDSLNEQLQNKKAEFDNMLIPLNKSIWQQVQLHDLLLEPIKKSIELRGRLFDNFKKVMVETRKPLAMVEQLYINETDTLIDKAGYRVLIAAKAIFQLIDKRNKIIEQCHKTKTQLIKYGLMNPQKLNEFETYIHNLNNDDFCWLRGKNAVYLTSIFKGFNMLQQAQKYFEWNIRKENRTEGVRSRFIGAENTKRRKKYSAILEHNRRVVFRKANKVKEYKRHYLYKLKKKARREKRKSKK